MPDYAPLTVRQFFRQAVQGNVVIRNIRCLFFRMIKAFYPCQRVIAAAVINVMQSQMCGFTAFSATSRRPFQQNCTVSSGGRFSGGWFSRCACTDYQTRLAVFGINPRQRRYPDD
ncbi:hypothetical protein [Morganella morganii]|uniref:hypothetical protein n=1 Tax=Morganella morganii TaxID=582 RepID=UPI0031F98E06